MKKLIWVLAALVLAGVLMCGVASAASSGTDGNITWSLSDDGVLTISGTGAMKDYGYSSSNMTYRTTAPWGASAARIVISEGVTSIGGCAFAGCNNLTSVTFPNSVTSIGSNAFIGCSNLISVTIPESVTRIGNYAFDYCNQISEVHIISLSSWLSITFGNNYSHPNYRHSCKLFINDSEAVNITIPNDISSIQTYSFYNMANIKSVSIPEGVNSINNYAFAKCSSLTSVSVPDSVTSIATLAFVECNSLSDFILKATNERFTVNGSMLLNKDQSALICCFATCTDVVIPNSVTVIRSNAFRGCSNLRSVILPDNISSIGDSTFLNCNSIENISIPSGVTRIGQSAFNGCSSLTSVIIPTGVASIGDYAFSNCTSLESIVIPNSVTSIGSYSFNRCTNLKNVTIPDSIASISSYAFSYCDNLASISLPETLTSIGERAFTYCSSLSRVAIPGNVTMIGSYAFSSCNSLTSVTVYPKSATIGSGAFPWSNPSLLLYVLPNSTALSYAVSNNIAYNELSVLSASGFSYYVLDGKVTINKYTGTETSITIPSSIGGYPVTSIVRGTFSDCTTLTSITIPNNVTSFNSGAVAGLTGLNTITYHGTIMSLSGISEYGHSGGVQWIIGTNNRLYMFGSGALLNYTSGSTLPWKTSACTNVIVLDGVSGIGDYAFYKCSSITSISLPESITTIGNYAFNGCSVLAGLAIPSNVTTIGTQVFEGCTALNSIVIPAGISTIESSTFSGCSGLTQATILNGVTSIGSNAFRNCIGLTQITIPESVTIIGDSAFYNCTGLTQIAIPESVTSIGSYAFYNCRGLTELVIPDSDVEVGASFIDGCSNLNTLTYHGNNMVLEGVSSSGTSGNIHWVIGKNKQVFFYGTGRMGEYTANSSLPWKTSNCTSAMIFDGVSNIGSYAFYNCSSLGQIILPDSISSVGNSAFTGCYAKRYTSIGSDCAISLSRAGYSFRNPGDSYDLKYSFTNGEISGTTLLNADRSIVDIVVPDGVTEVGGSAFSNCTGLTSCTLPEGLKSIGYNAFYSCSSLAAILIPESVITINNDAFYNCNAIRYVISDSGVAHYLSRAGYSFRIVGTPYDLIYRYDGTEVSAIELKNVDKDVSSISFPVGITSIGYSAFSGCTALVEASIPNSVTSIDSYAFSGCSNLSDIRIPESVTVIGTNAFQNCNSLKNITIPNNIMSIGSGVFNGCTGLETITILSKTLTIPNDLFPVDNSPFGLIVLANSTALSYAQQYDIPYTLYSSTGSSDYEYYETDTGIHIIGYLGTSSIVEIPSVIDDQNVIGISNGAFKDCNLITRIILPDGLLSIGRRAFENCTSIIEISIPNSVITIGAGAFTNCSELTEISLPEDIAVLSENMFSGCANLESIVIPAAVTTIGSNAFSGCSSLTEITLLGNMPSITSDLFAGCDGISTIVCANGSISPAQSSLWGVCGNNALYSLENGTLYIVGNGNMRGYDGTYSSGYYYDTPKPNTPWFGKSINRIVVGNGITSIGSRAFSTLSSVTSVSLPNTLTTIGLEAFERCGNLSQVTIPASVTKIDMWAFEDCRNLASITFLGNAPNIDSSTFNSVVSNVYYTPNTSWSGKALNYGGTLTWIKPNGSCGENAAWVLDDLTVLRLHGSGTVSTASWTQYSGTITTLIIASDIGGINGGLLSTLPNLTQIIFGGEVPMLLAADAFAGVSATAFYSHTKQSWTEEVRQNYGGSLTWQVYCTHSGATVADFEAIHYDATAPVDCVTNGYVEHWECSGCNRAFADEALTQIMPDDELVIPAPGHTLICIEGFPATCTEPGLSDEIFCEVCGETIQAQEEIPPVPHTDIITIQAIEPTCTSVGYTAEHRCEVCGELLAEVEEIEMVPHTDSIYAEAVEPTCSEVGHTEEHRCAVCGEILIPSEEIEKLPHTDAISIEALDPTCTETGHTEQHACAVCGEILTASEVIPATGHTYNDPAIVWSEDGKTCTFTFVCEHEDDTQVLEIAAAGTVEEAPACETMGTTLYTASAELNGQTYTETTTRMDIEATGHTPVDDPAVAPTDRETGLTAGSHCEVCGAVLVAKETIPALWSYSDDGLTATAYNGSATELTIPAGVTTLSNTLFKGNTTITTVIIPDSVTTVGTQTFFGASALTDVWLPDNLDGIGTQTFYNTTAALHATINSQTARALSLRNKAFTDGEWTLRYRVTSLTSDPTAVYLGGWHGEDEDLNLPDAFDGVPLTQIMSGAFDGQTQLESVTIPDSVATIAADAFNNCAEDLVIRSSMNAYARTWANNNGVAWAHDQHTPETIPAVAATCLEDGLTEGSMCSECGQIIAAQEVIPAFGHSWDEPAYTWNDENTEITASRICANDAEHVETEIVPVTGEVTKQPTCEEMGETTYTCGEFQNTAFTIQSKTLTDVPALDHAWGEPTYTWNEENTEVTATRICGNDGEHVERETVPVTSEVTKQPTCEAMGETTYTSGEFENSAFTVQAKILTDVPVLGHTWGEPTYTWNEENTEVTAIRICMNDTEHVQFETVGVQCVVTVSPTQTVEGEYKLVSAAFENEAFTIQEKAGGTIPALGTLSTPTFPTNLRIIEDEAFEGTSFQAVIIPDTVTTIGSRAFANCRTLVYVYIPASVTTIAPDAFADCPNVIIERAGN